MTCIPIPCTMHGATHATKATRNTQCINMQNNAKNKRNVTKTCKNMQSVNQTMAFKKTMATFRDERKGSLKRARDPLRRTHITKQDRERNKTRHTPHNLCDGGHSPSPIRPRTPRRSAHPSLPVENPVDNFGNPDHNVTVVMWKTPKPVENPVENSDSLWITLWKTLRKHDTHHSI